MPMQCQCNANAMPMPMQCQCNANANANAMQCQCNELGVQFDTWYRFGVLLFISQFLGGCFDFGILS